MDRLEKAIWVFTLGCLALVVGRYAIFFVRELVG